MNMLIIFFVEHQLCPLVNNAPRQFTLSAECFYFHFALSVFYQTSLEDWTKVRISFSLSISFSFLECVWSPKVVNFHKLSAWKIFLENIFCFTLSGRTPKEHVFFLCCFSCWFVFFSFFLFRSIWSVLPGFDALIIQLCRKEWITFFFDEKVYILLSF